MSDRYNPDKYNKVLIKAGNRKRRKHWMNHLNIINMTVFIVKWLLYWSEAYGRTLAEHFDSKELKFHTPNTVVVFSNEKPDVGQMSKDRWKIFQRRDEDFWM